MTVCPPAALAGHMTARLLPTPSIPDQEPESRLVTLEEEVEEEEDREAWPCAIGSHYSVKACSMLLWCRR